MSGTGCPMTILQRSLLVGCLALAACSSADPDEELRALIAAAEAAAEARDTGHFRSLLSDDYVDASGRRKQQLIDMIRGYFFVNSSVEVVNRIEEVTLAGDDAAEIVLQSGMLGRGGGGLLDLDGKLYRIELELVRESGDWTIIGADWERILE
jgi:hypothetical protein